MMKLKGIDVSYHNGTIDWNEVTKEVDFAIIRAGFGKGNIDEKFYDNSIGCEKANIPYGYYWFSYAYTPDMARAEADYMCELIRPFSPTYPICFDFEYGSLTYAKNHGYNLSNKDIQDICRAFLDRVEENGYYAMIYCNPDFLENYGLKELTSRYALWLAKWTNTPPMEYNYGIWQYGTTVVPGIVSEVDANYSAKDYDKIISALYRFKKEHKIKVALTLPDAWWNKYVLLAKRYLVGIYDDFELERYCRKNGMDVSIVKEIMAILYE